MKLPIMLFLLAFGFIGCEKEIENPDVEEFIIQLKSNSYSSQELPAFEPSDIPALLKYRNDTMIITNFPHNAISSLRLQDCKLGMYVLWTIESIRAVETDSNYLVGRFPSQNPVLALKTSAELKFVRDNNSQNEAAKAYYHWWHAIYIFTDKMKSDPLDDTDYKWE